MLLLVTYKAVGFARNNTGQAKQIKAGSVGRTVVSFEYVGRHRAASTVATEATPTPPQSAE